MRLISPGRVRETSTKGGTEQREESPRRARACRICCARVFLRAALERGRSGLDEASAATLGVDLPEALLLSSLRSTKHSNERSWRSNEMTADARRG